MNEVHNAHYYEEKNLCLSLWKDFLKILNFTARQSHLHRQCICRVNKIEPAKVSSNSTWLSSVCDSNNKVTSPSHWLSLTQCQAKYNQQCSICQQVCSLSKTEWWHWVQILFYSSKRRKSDCPCTYCTQYVAHLTDDKCMSPSLNPLSRLPSSSWLMRTRLN